MWSLILPIHIRGVITCMVRALCRILPNPVTRIRRHFVDSRREYYIFFDDFPTLGQKPKGKRRARDLDIFTPPAYVRRKALRGSWMQPVSPQVHSAIERAQMQEPSPARSNNKHNHSPAIINYHLGAVLS